MRKILLKVIIIIIAFMCAQLYFTIKLLPIESEVSSSTSTLSSPTTTSTLSSPTTTSTLSSSTTTSGATCAYVTYATSSTYFRGSLVVGRQLRDLGSKLPFIVVHTFDFSSEEQMKLKHINGTSRFTPILNKRTGYYRDCMVKLEVLRIKGYDRAIYVESDGFVVQKLDFLCEISAELAAPRSHWLTAKNEVTNIIMAFSPSENLYTRVMSFARQNDYDMDAINRYSPEMLPCHVCNAKCCFRRSISCYIL